MNTNASAFEPCAHTAVILAGGAGTRFGQQPKALTEWRGQRFIDHIIEALRPQVAHIAISSSLGNSQGNSLDNSLSHVFSALALPVLPDPFPERRGPLAGMLAGLSYSSTEFTLFVPCDTPLISAHLTQRLHTALLEHNADIAYAKTGSDHHYLFALIRTSLRDQLQNHFANGDYSVFRWYAAHATIAVAFDDEPEYFLNINTVEALQLLNRSH